MRPLKDHAVAVTLAKLGVAVTLAKLGVAVTLANQHQQYEEQKSCFLKETRCVSRARTRLFTLDTQLSTSLTWCHAHGTCLAARMGVGAKPRRSLL